VARTVRVVPNKRGMAEFRDRLALGLLAVMQDAELEAKREAPVRGAYRSFVPGTSPIGGTLRESVHSAVFMDGRQIASTSKGGPPNPEMQAVGGKVVGYVGTNCGYGAYVELGTRKMQERPYLGPGLDVAMRRAPATFTRGMGRAKP
jgi:hypothetical protein